MQLRQDGVERFKRRGIARNVATMPEEGIEIVEIREQQTAIAERV